jgi:hypothetical protein
MNHTYIPKKSSLSSFKDRPNTQLLAKNLSNTQHTQKTLQHHNLLPTFVVGKFPNLFFWGFSLGKSPNFFSCEDFGSVRIITGSVLLPL